MSHEIETHADQAAAIFARTDPWHRLGTVVRDRAFTAQEAMTLGHLGGWNVRKLPLTAHESSAALAVPGQYATARTNPFTGATDVLGVVGASYTPIQNEAHAQFLNTLADEAGAVFDTAGSLRGGRQVFLTMQLPQTLRVGDVDTVDLHLAALNSHDGTSAFRLLLTPVRIVCANTQSAALRRHRAAHSIRHTAGATAAVAAARDALGLTFAYVAEFEAEAQRLFEQTVTDARFDALVTDVFGRPDRDAPARTLARHSERRDTLYWLWADAPTQQQVRGTAWAAYQAVAEYVDHYAPVRGRDDPAVARATRLLTTDEPTRTKQAAWAALAG